MAEVPARERPPGPAHGGQRLRARRIALSEIGPGADLGELRFELYPLHQKNDTFPGEVFLELAANALEQAGASRAQPIEFERIRERVPAT